MDSTPATWDRQREVRSVLEIWALISLFRIDVPPTHLKAVSGSVNNKTSLHEDSWVSWGEIFHRDSSEFWALQLSPELLSNFIGIRWR